MLPKELYIMGSRISTSIKIDPEVLAKAKHYAIDHKTTLSELIEDALKEKMKK